LVLLRSGFDSAADKTYVIAGDWEDFGQSGFAYFATTLKELYATMCSNR
jgi:hypothetical protein